MDCVTQLVFYPEKVRFTLRLSGVCVKRDVAAASVGFHDSSDFSRVCILCADDQNPPRLQIMSAAQKLGIPIHQKRGINDVKDGVFRNEPHLKLFGRTIDEVSSGTWRAVAAEWKAHPAVLILDQNIIFEDTDCVYGTDICKQLRQELGFTGVIAIRSGNDSLQDREKYKNAGADETLPKTLTMEQLTTALAQLGKVALVRSMMLTPDLPHCVPANVQTSAAVEDATELAPLTPTNNSIKQIHMTTVATSDERDLTTPTESSESLDEAKETVLTIAESVDVMVGCIPAASTVHVQTKCSGMTDGV